MLIIQLFVCFSTLEAQVEHFSEISNVDMFRLKQLSDQDSIEGSSFTIRSTSVLNALRDRRFGKKRKDFSFTPYSIGYTFQKNDNLGLGYNDGSMLPSVGSQDRVMVNMEARWKGLVVTIAPELLRAENLAPQDFVLNSQDPNYMARYYLFIVNKVDAYSRFGVDKIQKTLLGQSGIRYENKSFSIGISNENLWWGPGVRNSLVMTNNATGFPHLSFNTIKPVKSKFGQFEGQVILGLPTNPEFDHPDNARMRKIWEAGIAKKDSSSRSLAGFVIDWQPVWTKNLHIGMASSSMSYLKNKEGRLLAFPLFISRKPIKLGSMFLRYVMPKDKTELYIEYGRADKMTTLFNILRDSIPSGYTAGIRKLFQLSNGKSHFMVGIEVTRLQLPDPRLIFTLGNPYGAPQTNSWYASSQILQGYTNYGQVIGAGIGPGSNSQTLQLAWVKGAKKISITGERVARNNDFYYYNYITNSLVPQYQNPNKFWADINATGQIQWNIRNLMIGGSWSYTSLLNYRWLKLDGGFSGPSKISDKRNTQISASAVWFFNKNMLN
jgi:hypothetical protein